MIRSIFLATAASAAVALAGPVAAKPGAGANVNVNAGANAGGPSQTAIDARVNSQGAANASEQGILNSSPNSALQTGTTTTTRATRSQGPANAAPRAVERANSNSVLARTAVPATALPGLTTGLTVQNSTGVTIGTVSQVVTGTDGSIRLVVVTSPSGETLRLAPKTLSISGGVVTTTSTTIGG